MGQRRVIKPAEERRQELIDAARELFLEQGYEHTTMSQIAERARVAQGTFYIYFSSKQEVLTAIMKDLLESMAETVQQLAERTDLPASAVLHLAMDECLSLMSREVRLVEAVYLKANYSLPSQLQEQVAPRLLPIIISIIERGVREGVLTVKHPAIAADFLWTVGYRLFELAAQQLIDAGKGTDNQAAVHPIAEMKDAFREFVTRALGVT